MADSHLAESRALIREQVQQARARADIAQEAIDRTRATKATASSTAGEVVVTARADGTVTDIQFSHKAEAVDLDQLGRLLVTTIDQAQQRAARAAVAGARAELGDSGFVEVLAARVDERYGPEPTNR